MAWLGTSEFKWALERPHSVPTTPTLACQRHDRQRHLRARSLHRVPLQGPTQKTIFIQANGSLERDYWCRHKSCTPVVGATAAHYHGISRNWSLHWFTVFRRAETGPFFCNNARRIWSACEWLEQAFLKTFLHTYCIVYTVKVLFNSIADEGVDSVKLGSLIFHPPGESATVCSVCAHSVLLYVVCDSLLHPLFTTLLSSPSVWVVTLVLPLVLQLQHPDISSLWSSITLFHFSSNS